jgi:hypothetical protein
MDHAPNLDLRVAEKFGIELRRKPAECLCHGAHD